MALYTDLPVYKAAYDLLLEVFTTTKNFPREYKYTIGQELKKEAIELIKRIYLANSDQKTRTMHLIDARSRLEIIRLYVRLLKDLQQLNMNKLIALNEKIEPVSKQLASWQRASG